MSLRTGEVPLVFTFFEPEEYAGYVDPLLWEKLTITIIPVNIEVS